MHLGSIKRHKEFCLNKLGHDYFVGDIHGHYHLLMEQLAQAHFNFDNDRLFAVGDLIDRGTESEKCIELLMEPWFHSVLGNHEHLFLQGFNSPAYWQVLIDNGGSWIENWFYSPDTLLAWGHLMRTQMPLAISVKTALGVIGLVHGDAPVDWHTLAQTNVDDFAPYIWHRQDFLAQDKAPILGIDAVFHGHNQVRKVKVINNQLWADTVQKTARLSLLSVYDVFNYINKNKA